MDTINNGICRCCSSEGTFKDVSTRYQWMGEEEVYADMLKECFDITLSPSDDGQEAGICEVCITQLRNSANFKRQVQQTEEQFKRRLQDLPFKSNIVKVEASPLEDPVHGVSDDDSKFSDEICFAGDFQEVPIKTESSDEVKSKKRSAKATTSRAKQPKLEAETSNKRKRLRTKKTKYDLEPEFLITEIREIPEDQKRPVPELQKHRSNITLILQHSNATPLNRGTIGYGCCYCTDQFIDAADLKVHTLSKHKDIAEFMEGSWLFSFHVKLDITALQCNICGDPFDSLEEFTDHLIEVHDKKIYTGLKSRLLPFKFEGDTLRCVICMKEFSKFKVLVEHMSNHYRNFVCDVCDAGYVTQKMLNNHMKNHQLGDFQCDFCGKNFNTFLKKRNHEQSVHVRVNWLHKCDSCSRRFLSSVSKDIHIAKNHGVFAPPPGPRTTKIRDDQERNVDCPACEKTFATPASLLVHTKRVHLMEKDFECQECGSRFFTSKDLRNHMVKHTGVREFQCEVCSKWYTRKYSLQEHMRIHANDKRFKCEVCGMGFVQNRGMKAHMKVRHGKLPGESIPKTEQN